MNNWAFSYKYLTRSVKVNYPLSHIYKTFLLSYLRKQDFLENIRVWATIIKAEL